VLEKELRFLKSAEKKMGLKIELLIPNEINRLKIEGPPIKPGLV